MIINIECWNCLRFCLESLVLSVPLVKILCSCSQSWGLTNHLTRMNHHTSLNAPVEVVRGRWRTSGGLALDEPRVSGHEKRPGRGPRLVAEALSDIVNCGAASLRPGGETRSKDL